MLATRLEANERHLANLFYAPEQPMRWNRKTLFAITAVAALYAALGAYLAYQKWVVLPLYIAADDRVVMDSVRLPPPDKPKPVDEPPPPAPPTSVTQEPVITPRIPPIDPVIPQPPPLAIVPPLIPAPPPTGPAIALATPGPVLPVSPPRPTAPSVILNPDWISRPSPAQANIAFPSRALRLGVSGRAELVCTVQVTGSVAGCTVAAETPSAYGFGGAALSMAQYFKMKPRTVDGAPVEGAKVRIPVDFTAGG